ncbi:hypothetical protein [Faecalicatena contorta]|uniref:hypothetical protein n=1 Tax=Faecalicatena contorta TaxID=39482 RepID=UPI001F1E34E4|nr:hypothetical protein [Faecalicatena contorta]MCF2554408.1 hypothetical protein [Faecalicatena contorta]
MCGIDQMLWLLQTIEAVGFCNFIFQKKRCGIDNGFILVAEDDYHARKLESVFLEKLCAKRVDKKGTNAMCPNNYELGIHLFHKYDKEADLVEFLSSKNFFPIMIVGGIVPEFLFGRAYVFRCYFSEIDVIEYDAMYQKMKKMVLKSLEHLEYELENLHTSKHIQNCKVDKALFCCFKTIVAAGKVWEIVLRENNDEETTKRWFDSFCEYAVSALETMDDFFGVCDISEVFRQCVLQYIRKNDIPIKEFGVFSDEIGDETIYIKDDYYYFQENLLKKICLPIAQTVSFSQIKKELRDGGILSCNNCSTNNYTVKVTSYDSQKGRIVRKRFLKIKKSHILSEEGLTLEEILFFNKESEDDSDGDDDWIY